MKEAIITALCEHLPIHYVAIQDQSAAHQGHTPSLAPAHTHFAVTIVSTAFEGVSLPQRHRTINHICAPFFEQTLHALSLQTKTPTEWERLEAGNKS